MKSIFIIAWRNLWRNKKRSLITMGSIVMAVVLTIFMRSLQLGSYSQMIQGGINQIGNIQVHLQGYWDKQTINNAMVITPKLKQTLANTQGIKSQTTELNNFVLVSSGAHTKGAMIMGAIPNELDTHLGLKKKLIYGQYLTQADTGILVAKRLAEFLHLITIRRDTIIQKNKDIQVTEKITLKEDSLIMIGSGYQGISAYGLLPIRGIVDLSSPHENQSMIYTSLSNVQNLFSPYIPNLCTSISLRTHEDAGIEEIKQTLQTKLGTQYEVMSWDEMMSDILQGIKVDNISGILMLGLLYVIVGFGMLSTVIMSTIERRKEQAIMLSIGMQKSKMILMVIIENLLLGMISIIVGCLMIFSFIYYLHINPIPLSGSMAEMFTQYNIPPVLPFSVDPSIFIWQSTIVLSIVAICMIYPIVKVLILKPTD